MSVQEDNKISFYTFPHNIRSHNVCTENCLVQKLKVFVNGMQIHPLRHCSNFNFFYSPSPEETYM